MTEIIPNAAAAGDQSAAPASDDWSLTSPELLAALRWLMVVERKKVESLGSPVAPSQSNGS